MELQEKPTRFLTPRSVLGRVALLGIPITGTGTSTSTSRPAMPEGNHKRSSLPPKLPITTVLLHSTNTAAPSSERLLLNRPTR
eukprot:1786699-Rhodomonas_salina.1